MVMKFFRKKQEAEDIKDVQVPSGTSDDNVIPASPSKSQHMYLGTARNKEEAQRRFMQRLYKLSETHGAASVKSVSAASSLDKSEDSPDEKYANSTEPILQASGTHETSPETTPTSTAETSPAMSPVTSPSRAKEATLLADQHQESVPVLTPTPPSTAQTDAGSPSLPQETMPQANLELHDSPWDFGVTIEPGCMRAMIQQIAACTDDFFGDKLATASHRRVVPQGRRPTVEDTSNRGLSVVDIPSVITFGPSRGNVADTAISPVAKSSKRKYEFEDELDGIIGNYDGPNNSSIAYTISERESSSLIDKVWLVSSFGGDNEEACVEEIATVSVTSSISTRHSCLL